MIDDQLIEEANNNMVNKILRSKVVLTAVADAKSRIPILKDRYILHSGPPIKWEQMCETMRSAICGALVYEGWANDLDEANLIACKGEVGFDSAHNHGALGPMAGVISPSMPVFVMKNSTFGNVSHVTINEGLGKTLRFGANDNIVINRLKWIEAKLGPMLNSAIQLSGPIDITNMIARGIQRGDECHNRNKASTSLFIRFIAPYIIKTSFVRDDIAEALTFMDNNDHFFLNLSMGASKATMDPVINVPNSTLVSCIATNGVNIGIKVAGIGNTWITAEADYAKGNYFKGFSDQDANRVMGDSYISETCGLGGVAMAAAPGIGSFIGISVDDAVAHTRQMYNITVAEHETYKIPILNFRGSPLGIDIRKVVKTGILPVINTGIAHKKAGIGQIGAGITKPPMECFQKAVQVMGLSVNLGETL